MNKAQLILHGSISDNLNTPITGSILKVKKRNRTEFLYFEVLHQKSEFEIAIQKIKKGDTLEIKIEHNSYTPLTEILIITELPQKKELQITLSPFVKELKEIILKPAIWKRGDTTIYTIDSFATGEERKLKDIITKLPGFTVDHDGKLKFKNKTVEKIFIEGEDLFAERTGLLLESFPVHVLSQIEAIENDPKNKLLKGLSLENQTVVNLKLKDKKNVVFGDAELNGTTNSRYAVNPTLFSISRKVKIATIGFYNNMGVNFEKVYPPFHLSYVTNPPILKLGNIYTINNFNASRYLMNRLLNQQVMVKYKLLKKIDSKTEISYGNEHINQPYSNQNIFIDTSATFNRFDSLLNLSNSKRTRVNQEIDWNNKNKERFVAGFAWEGSALNNTSANYIRQQGFEDTVISGGKEQKQFLILKLQYTRRVDSLRAFVIQYNYQEQKNEQAGSSFSNNISSIFSLGNPDFNLTLINGLFSTKEQDLKFEWFRKKNQYTITHNIMFSRNNIDLNANFNVGQKNNPASASVNFPEFSNTGIFTHNNASYLTRYFRKKNSTILSMELSGGGSYIVRKEKAQRIEKKFLPTVRVFMSYTYLPGKKRSIPFTVEFTAKPVSIENLALNPILVQYNSLQQFMYPLKSIPTIKLTAGYSQTKLNGVFKYYQFSFTRVFSSEIMSNRFNLFFNFDTRGLSNIATNQYMFYTNHNIPLSNIKAVFEVNLSSTFHEQLIQSTTGVVKSTNLSSNGAVRLRFRNFRKVSLLLEASGIYYQNFIPSSSGFKNLDRKLLNFIPKFNVRWNIAKNFSTGFQSSWYHFDVINNTVKLLFADGDLIWKPNDSKFSLEMKCENIFNENTYVITNVLFNTQSLTNIPLIGRNFQASLRFNF